MGRNISLDMKGVLRDRSSVIKSFNDKRTVAVFEGARPKGFPTDIIISARRRLGSLDAASSLSDLRNPPSNRLEALKGDRAGQYSIRVNDQWRVCFRWLDGEAYDVEITAYH